MDFSFLRGGVPVQMPDPAQTFGRGLALSELARRDRMNALQEDDILRQRKVSDAFNAVLPDLAAAGYSPDALVAAMKSRPEVASALVEYVDKRRKSEADIRKTTAGAAKDEVDAAAKAFDHLGGVAFNEAQNPDKLSLSRVQAVAQRIGMPLPQFSGDATNPQSVQQYLASIAAAGYAVKDQVAGMQKDRDLKADEVERIWRRQFDTGKQVEQVRHNQSVERSSAISAGASASNASTAAARLQWEKEQGKAPTIQTGPGGELYAVDPRAATGRPITGADGQPLVKGSAKPPEAYSKQVAGIENLNTAIAEYKDALSKFGITSALSPAARAEMGTKYNNMMLQAKEAYNLGVLNGPDYSILQEVVTNPMSVMGMATPNTALDKQASELSRIMQVNAGNLAKVYKQPPPATAAKQAPAAPKIGEKRDGYIYKGGDPASPSSWEKM